MTIHRLKTWPEFYGAVEDGRKTVELRYDDRDYAVGDILLLREYLPGDDARYTGRSTTRVVTHIVRGEWGVEPGYVAMSIGGAA